MRCYQNKKLFCLSSDRGIVCEQCRDHIETTPLGRRKQYVYRELKQCHLFNQGFVGIDVTLNLIWRSRSLSELFRFSRELLAEMEVRDVQRMYSQHMPGSNRFEIRTSKSVTKDFVANIAGAACQAYAGVYYATSDGIYYVEMYAPETVRKQLLADLREHVQPLMQVFVASITVKIATRPPVAYSPWLEDNIPPGANADFVPEEDFEEEGEGQIEEPESPAYEPSPKRVCREEDRIPPPPVSPTSPVGLSSLHSTPEQPSISPFNHSPASQPLTPNPVPTSSLPSAPANLPVPQQPAPAPAPASSLPPAPANLPVPQPPAPAPASILPSISAAIPGPQQPAPAPATTSGLPSDLEDYLLSSSPATAPTSAPTSPPQSADSLPMFPPVPADVEMPPTVTVVGRTISVVNAWVSWLAMMAKCQFVSPKVIPAGVTWLQIDLSKVPDKCHSFLNYSEAHGSVPTGILPDELAFPVTIETHSYLPSVEVTYMDPAELVDNLQLIFFGGDDYQSKLSANFAGFTRHTSGILELYHLARTGECPRLKLIDPPTCPEEITIHWSVAKRLGERYYWCSDSVKRSKSDVRKVLRHLSTELFAPLVVQCLVHVPSPVKLKPMTVLPHIHFMKPITRLFMTRYNSTEGSVCFVVEKALESEELLYVWMKNAKNATVAAVICVDELHFQKDNMGLLPLHLDRVKANTNSLRINRNLKYKAAASGEFFTYLCNCTKVPDGKCDQVKRTNGKSILELLMLLLERSREDGRSILNKCV